MDNRRSKREEKLQVKLFKYPKMRPDYKSPVDTCWACTRLRD